MTHYGAIQVNWRKVLVYYSYKASRKQPCTLSVLRYNYPYNFLAFFLAFFS